MWAAIAKFILKYRIAFLAGVLLTTAFFGFKAKEVKLSFNAPQVIPTDDPDLLYYSAFQKNYGADNNVIIVGFQNQDVFQKDLYNSWRALSERLSKEPEFESATSITNLVYLHKASDSAGEPLKRFTLSPLQTGDIETDELADSLKEAYNNLPFYNGLFYNDTTHATFMAIKLTQVAATTELRLTALDKLVTYSEEFAQPYGIEMHYSGLPYFRTRFAKKVQRELNLFLILSVVVTSVVLLFFFRSASSVVFPLLIIGIIITWTLGMLVLFGYEITLLTGLLPPLIVIIAVPNFIYFLNRFHTEYKKYRNKEKAVIQMVQNIGQVIFLNNITTAIGFGVLYFINVPMMQEFGLIAFLTVLSIYVITLILLPIVMSYLPVPNAKQTKYMESKAAVKVLDGIVSAARSHSKLVLGACAVVIIVAVIGVFQLKAEGYVLDDIPESDNLKKDLAFFESHFKGIMPLEVIVESKKDNVLRDINFLSAVAKLSDTIASMPHFARPLSVADMAKYARQAYYNGSLARYGIPQRREQAFIAPYLSDIELNNISTSGYRLTDSLQSEARLSTRMADIGSIKLEAALEQIRTAADSLLPEEATVSFTGFSYVYLQASKYLVSSLKDTLFWAISLITLVIALLFRSLRLVLITILPNCLALLVTAAIMGYFDIALKPSTILVFSVAFGIAVDASFHFLVRYRHDLQLHNWDISKTIAVCMHETGLSIIYTSLVLLFGFGIFCFSSFGSTFNLGLLTAITILTATFTNLVVIPTLLQLFDREPRRVRKLRLATKAEENRPTPPPAEHSAH